MFCCEVGGVEDNVLGSELETEDREDTEEVSSQAIRHLLLRLGHNRSINFARFLQGYFCHPKITLHRRLLVPSLVVM